MNVLPRMHLFAREVHGTLVNPDGTTVPLLDIGRWNFKRQDRDGYREPILLPKGAKVRCRCVFDKSERNPNNPFSPPRPVQFGLNATDERCALYLGIIPGNLDDVPVFAAAREQKLKEKIAELRPSNARAATGAKRWIAEPTNGGLRII